MLLITLLILGSVIFFNRSEIIKNTEDKVGPLWSGLVRAKDSHYLTLFSSYQTAQKIHKEFYGAYSESESAIGYQISDSNISLITSVANLPEKYKMQIKESDLPYVDRDFYQVLVVVNDSGEEAVWQVRSNAESIKILPRPSGAKDDRN